MSASREFFALPEHDKRALSMTKSGRHWKGWFKLGGELTSGSPDHKEGLYLGDDLPLDHPDVIKGTIMHGPCQWPALKVHPGEARTACYACWWIVPVTQPLKRCHACLVFCSCESRDFCNKCIRVDDTLVT